MNRPRDSRPRWAVELSATLFALTRSRLTLRRAARQVEDRRLSQRLLRLARRRRAASTELRREAQGQEVAATIDSDVTPFPSEIATATEIGAVAACLRANRRLRAAVQRTLEADPPPGIRRRLGLLRDETDRDAAQLNSRLNGLVVARVPATTSHPGATTSPTAPGGTGPSADNVTTLR